MKELIIVLTLLSLLLSVSCQRESVPAITEHYHIWDEGIIIKDSTCTEYGTVEFSCIECDVFYREDRPMKDHEMKEVSVIKPTRTEGGYTLFACSACQKEEKDDFTSPLGRTEKIDSNNDGILTIDEYLGAYDIVDFLDDHAEEYLSTPYRGLYDYNYFYDPDELTHCIGLYPDSAKMNCAGFIASVFIRCGANTDLFYKCGGAYANTYTWERTVLDNGIKYTKYYSIEEALNSGELKKGDILLFLPAFEDGDYHIGFFWGDSSEHDLFWHSSGWVNYNTKYGVASNSNQITRIAPVSPYSYFLHIPLQA